MGAGEVGLGFEGQAGRRKNAPSGAFVLRRISQRLASALAVSIIYILLTYISIYFYICTCVCLLLVCAHSKFQSIAVYAHFLT